MTSMTTRRSLALILGIALVTTLVACGGGSGGGESADNATLATGEKVFMQTCATCHGQDANGIPNLGKGLRNNQFTKTASDAEMLQFLLEGRPASDPLNTTGVDMPPKGGNPSLSEEDLQAVVAYLRTL